MPWSTTARLALSVALIHFASGFGDFKFPAWGASKAPEVPKRVVPPETETRPVVIYSPAFTRHRPRTGDLPTPYHPERPARVINAEKQLREKYGEGLAWREPGLVHDNEAAINVLKQIHKEKHLAKVKALSESGGGLLDWQTYTNEETYSVALLAASAWMEAVDVVLGGAGPAMALARPPGHHATPDEAMGFCIFCNAAAAAKHALESGAERVAILDWDVHHGNGIQDCVAGDDRIRFLSLHQGDAYPDWDAQRANRGNTVNVPLPRGTTGKKFLAALEEALPFIDSDEWRPDLLIVAAGYDALVSDPVAQLSLQPESFADFSVLLKERFGKRLVFGLEGGYELEGMPKAVVRTLEPFVTGKSPVPADAAAAEEKGVAATLSAGGT